MAKKLKSSKDEMQVQYQDAPPAELTEDAKQDLELPHDDQTVDKDDATVIKIGESTDAHKTANKFDIFWLKVWAVICSFI